MVFILNDECKECTHLEIQCLPDDFDHRNEFTFVFDEVIGYPQELVNFSPSTKTARAFFKDVRNVYNRRHVMSQIFMS